MTRVLVPVELLEGETISPGLMALLGTVDVTVLGYHVLPEQTPPDQARLQFEDRATDALEDLTEGFRDAGGAADHRLVFTHDRERTLERVADETNARAIAITGVTGDVDRILVSLSDDVAVDRILVFVEEIVGGRDVDVTLCLVDAGNGDADVVGDVAVDDGVDADADAAVDDAGTDSDARLAAAATRLRDAGIDVETTLATEYSPLDGLLEALPGHDAIVMGEDAPSLRSVVFGDDPERVASASLGPVLVVRYDETLDG
jgi:nucleotide-binding universal stress UspA family protein